jgi:ribonuclease VapC
VIVDTSALLAVLRGEPEAPRFIDILLAQEAVRASVGTLIEARIVVEREADGAAQLGRVLQAFSVDPVPVDLTHIELASEGFRRFGKGRHPARLNFGDLFSYALARALDEPLLYKGDDFAKTDVRSAL